MKNLFYVSFLFLLFSCAGESKSNKDSATTNPTAETPQNQTNSDVNSNQAETKVLAKNDLQEAIVPGKVTPEVPAKNISSKEIKPSTTNIDKTSTSPTPKNEKEAKAKLEVEKAKALAEKTRLEEEMKKAYDQKNRDAEISNKDAETRRIEAAEKAKLEAKAAAEKAEKEQQVGKLSGSGNTKPTSEAGLHDELDDLLRKYVSSTGKVNYKGLKNDEAKLDSYLEKLEKTNVEKGWGRNEELAFWINAYNAYTIKLILKNYPVKSIMDLHNGKPWDVKWIKLDQRTLSLNNIENDIIRPKFNEPRIHFAVNCAAKSCPPLLNKAWTASNLNSNFEKQTKSFINNSDYNTITTSKVEVSKIFDWYGKDFGDLRTYLNKYSNTNIDSGVSINFKSYNWELNN